MLDEDPAITHVAMVHSETTSGILNDIQSVGKVVEGAGRTMIVDAMSSFGGVDIPVGDWGIDFLSAAPTSASRAFPDSPSSSAAGRSCWRARARPEACPWTCYDQWKTMEKDGKWRFTSPTHVVLAFCARPCEELEEEGGIPARHRRYAENNRLLIRKMESWASPAYIAEEHQGPIITTFFYPENCNFLPAQMYAYIKERGYAIYPGKVTDADTFRIGNIGEIYEEDIVKLIDIIGIPGRERAGEMIEAVIFDWAGTTVDYGCFAPVQAFQEVFKH